jgi:membrane protein DedA with SNARE-associated domain
VPEWLLDLFTRYGYAVVFVGVLLENAGLPVPGETVLLGGGAMAQFGRLSLVRVMITAMAAAVIGDNIGFLIGRRGGRSLAARHGGGRPHRRSPDPVRPVLRALRTADRVHRAVVTGLRVFCAVLAGASGLDWRTFLFCNALGAVVWSIAIASAVSLAYSWDAQAGSDDRACSSWCWGVGAGIALLFLRSRRASLRDPLASGLSYSTFRSRTHRG